MINDLCPQVGPGNETCGASLLHSDRLMLVYLLYSNLEDVWSKAACERKSYVEIHAVCVECMQLNL